ncbi:hypothetical protein M422DRAFT_36122, partial [Sphaerobolus stellatus SS14]
LSAADYVRGPGPALEEAQKYLLKELQGDLRHKTMLTYMELPQDDYILHYQLLTAMSMVQAAGLFHSNVVERQVSTGCHPLLITMTRRSPLLELMVTYQPPDSAAQLNEETWRQWTLYESIKRRLLIIYAHDAFMPVLFGIRPVMSIEESISDKLTLPCDDTLWYASSAKEWASLQALYDEDRLRGQNLRQTLCQFWDFNSKPPQLNDHSSFIIIIVILRASFFIIEGHHDWEYNAFSLKKALARWYEERCSPHPPETMSNRHNYTFTALPMYYLALFLSSDLSKVYDQSVDKFDKLAAWMWGRGQRPVIRDHLLLEDPNISNT